MIRQAVIAPQPAHEVHLLGLTFPSVAVRLVQSVVLDLVPAGANAQAESVVGKHSHLSGLLGYQHGLPLRQDQHRGDHLQLLRHRGDEREGGEGFVKGGVLVVCAFPAARAVRIGAQHMVVDQQVGNSKRFDSLGVGFDGAGIVADFVVWKNRSEFHGVPCLAMWTCSYR